MAAPRSLTLPRVIASAVAGMLCLLMMLQTTPAFAQNSAQEVPAKPAREPVIPRFEQVAGAAGLVHRFDSDAEFSVGGGAAAFDCDGDKDADLFMAGGNGPASLYRNTGEIRSALQFEDISANLGLNEAEIRRVSGGYAFDFDNDGDLDLFVMRFGVNRLLRNEGDCTFSVIETPGLANLNQRTTAFAAGWLPGGTFPAMFVGNHVNPAPEPGATGRCGESYFLLPGEQEQPVYDRRRPLAPAYCPMSYLLVDWSGRGKFDLRATNDATVYGEDGEDQLFHLSNGVAPYTEDEGWKKRRIDGGGLTARDIDGDGIPEIVAADRSGARLYVLRRDGDEPRYADRSVARGVAMDGAEFDGPVPVFSWHVGFADFNNDAMSDLLVVRGQRQSPPGASAQDHDMLLLGMAGGRFRNAAREAGLALRTVGRGAAIADFDRDGCQDIVVVNRSAPASLFRNLLCDDELSPGWLDVDLEQDGVNTDAVGASVILRAGEQAQTQTVTIGGGHAGGAAGPLHFGLGESREAVLRVRWPDGSITDPITLPANRSAIIRRSGQTITVNMGE